eukprot:3190598-Alexandrium_andersonii.AAC.1
MRADRSDPATTGPASRSRPSSRACTTSQCSASKSAQAATAPQVQACGTPGPPSHCGSPEPQRSGGSKDLLRREVAPGGGSPHELLSVLLGAAPHETHVLERPEDVRAPVRVGARNLRPRRRVARKAL